MLDVQIVTALPELGTSQLVGFFEGWPSQPSPGTLLRILKGSDHVGLAMDGETVVGFATAISDGVLAGFIPLLEVRPEYRGDGLGKRLIEAVRGELGELYSIDLVCDEELVEFYESMGFQKLTAMAIRKYDNQAGRPTGPRQT